MNAERSLRIVCRLSDKEYAEERDAINAKHGKNGAEAKGLRANARLIDQILAREMK